MRLFIAIGIPQEVKEHLLQIQGSIDTKKNKFRFVSKGNIHLTLKFLGDVHLSKLSEINNNLKKINFKPFSAYLDKIGVFPSENLVRVVWIGLVPENPILELQKKIDDSLENLFKKERNFRPHLTVARVKFIQDKKDFVEKLKKINVQNKKINVGNFRLMKSSITPNGPIYEVIGIFGK